jgi:hypothetical protein
MVFFAAAAQFVAINRANRKHLLNDCRVAASEIPRDFSAAAKVVGWLALVLGLLGTLIWAYGDKLHVA